MKLKSYVQGRWIAGTDAGVAVRDATTGAVVAEVSSAGIDFGVVVVEQSGRDKRGTDKTPGCSELAPGGP